MLKEINLKNWKSFKKLDFKFENLNILIGQNSSGKSNFLEALELLKLKALDKSDDEINKMIRGGVEYFKTISARVATCQAVIENEEILGSYEIKISGNKISEKMEEEEMRKMTQNITKLRNEVINLDREIKELTIQLEKIEAKNIKDEYDKLRYFDILLDKIALQSSLMIKKDKKMTTEKTLSEQKRRSIVNKYKGIDKLKKDMKKIRVLDPIPKEIRLGNTSNEETVLDKNCKNLIPYILNHKNKNIIEKELLKYLNLLIGKNIEKIEFKKVGDNEESGQIYLEEVIVRNGNKVKQKLHAEIISDGTLRFIAIVCALLTQEKGSLLAIEEIDNGIAPSKTKMLLEAIDNLSLEREFDILVTTHNINLMNYIGKKYFEFIFLVCKEECEYSKILRLRDIKNISKIMSYGQIGDLLESGEFYTLAGINEFTNSEKENTVDKKLVEEFLKFLELGDK